MKNGELNVPVLTELFIVVLVTNVEDFFGVTTGEGRATPGAALPTNIISTYPPSL